jgi:hypothetical protein
MIGIQWAKASTHLPMLRVHSITPMDLRAADEYVSDRVLNFLNEIPIARRPLATRSYGTLQFEGRRMFFYAMRSHPRHLTTTLYVDNKGTVVTEYMERDACLWRSSHVFLTEAVDPMYRERTLQ